MIGTILDRNSSSFFKFQLNFLWLCFNSSLPRQIRLDPVLLRGKHLRLQYIVTFVLHLWAYSFACMLMWKNLKQSDTIAIQQLRLKKRRAAEFILCSPGGATVSGFRLFWACGGAATLWTAEPSMWSCCIFMGMGTGAKTSHSIYMLFVDANWLSFVSVWHALYYQASVWLISTPYSDLRRIIKAGGLLSLRRVLKFTPILKFNEIVCNLDFQARMFTVVTCVVRNPSKIKIIFPSIQMYSISYSHTVLHSSSIWGNAIYSAIDQVYCNMHGAWRY